MRKTSTPKRFASYLRCSSDDQSFGDFTTIDTQRNLNKERIEQLGGTLISEYNDEGKTGTNLKRDGWKRLIADAEAKKFDAVVVTYMSRLARGEMYHVAEYLLSEANVRIEMVQEQFTPDLAGQMNKSLKIFLDGMYPKQVSEWTKTKQAQMVAAGYHTGGARPFGYAVETVPGMQPTQLAGGKVKPAPKRKVPHPEEADHVRKCFETFLGTSSIAHVQRYLRSVDQTRNWPMSAVRALLSNDVYRGVLRFGGNVNDAAHEPIISEQLWGSVQELLASPERQVASNALGRHQGRIKDQTPYYLRGIVYCAHCGGRMTPSEATGRLGRVPYYECIQAAKNAKSCPLKRINAHMLHEAIVSEIVRCSMHPSRLNRLWEESVKSIPMPTEARDELARLRRNLRETQKKAGRVVEAIKQVGALPALADEVRQLEELATSQQTQINELESAQVRRTISRPDAARVAAYWGRLLDLWEVLSEEERSRLLRLIVNRIEVTDKSKGTTWLCLAAHQEAPRVNLSLSQGEDARFTSCEDYSAEIAPHGSFRTPVSRALASFLSIPLAPRRRRGNDNHGLVTRVRFALASNQPGELSRHH